MDEFYLWAASNPGRLADDPELQTRMKRLVDAFARAFASMAYIAKEPV